MYLSKFTIQNLKYEKENIIRIFNQRQIRTHWDEELENGIFLSSM